MITILFLLGWKRKSRLTEATVADAGIRVLVRLIEGLADAPVVLGAGLGKLYQAARSRAGEGLLVSCTTLFYGILAVL